MRLPTGAVRVRDLTPPADTSLFPVVDEVNGIIKGVKLVGHKGRNANRQYSREVRERAVRLYEGAALNLSHLIPGQTQRSFESRLGWAESPEVREDGTYGTIRFNPEHPYAKTLVWWAKNNPRGIGISHDAVVRKEFDSNGDERVTEILAVLGLDLVADPSTTAGLTEALDMDPLTAAPTDEGYEAQVGALVAAIMRDPALSLDEKKKKILVALKLMEDGPAVDDKPADPVTPAVEAFDVKAFLDGLGKTLSESNAALVAALKPAEVTKVTEAVTRPAAPPITAVGREAAPVVDAAPTKPKEMPPLGALLTKARETGNW